ncbi:hypothetical protein OE88DRAFT_1668200 [Heliocybe sulcata]|uniref:Probable acetate kinase n=1 Tax=Heliocybe sulcata TaxID=5364 RepID=A0A5C3MMS3_9AGAM|nr:hypothetical protein OE88DRAFT_1668200 [Heliocybe sulcata]
MSADRASKKGLVLAVNAGSSSLKVSLFRLAEAFIQGTDLKAGTQPVELILTYSITNITAPPAKESLSFASDSSQKPIKGQEVEGVKDHSSAFERFLKSVQDRGIKQDDIVHVCHRVVHGGDYHEAVVISDKTYEHIEKLTDLAPLHNGSALSVIEACIKQLRNANSIAYFDSSFHRTMPQHICSYAINPKIAKERGLKKYGFHGLSYAFILRSVAQFLGKEESQTNIIAVHLGSGASAVAIKDGKSLDTSMGLTPLSGLPGATRAGMVDPSLIFHYTNKVGRMSHKKEHQAGVGVTEAEEILNTQSGWKALTGTTNFAEITSSDSPEHRLAFDLFVDKILDFIGSYYVKLGGNVDALVFAGGIGEKSKDLREAVAKGVECLGFKVDDAKNGKVGEGDEDEIVVDIGVANKGQPKRVLMCRTDEQLEMARECALTEKFWE